METELQTHSLMLEVDHHRSRMLDQPPFVPVNGEAFSHRGAAFEATGTLEISSVTVSPGFGHS